MTSQPDTTRISELLQIPTQRIQANAGKLFTPSDLIGVTGTVEEDQKIETALDARGLYLGASVGSDRQAILYEIWYQMAFAQADKVTTLAEAKLAYEASPTGTPAETLALTKWAEATELIEEIQELWKHIPENSPLSSVVIAKLDTLIRV